MADFASLNEREKTILIQIHGYLSLAPSIEQIQEVNLKSLLVDLIPLGFVMPTIRKMISESLIARVDSNLNYGELAYELTDVGLYLADELVNEGKSSIILSASAIDADWEPLPVEITDDQKAKTLEKFEALVERVRGENGFAVSDPVAHAVTLSTLERGMTLLRSGRAAIGEYAAVLKKPALYLAKRFTDSAIGKLAEAALAAMRDWLAS